MTYIEQIKHLEKRLNELETRQKRIIEQFDLIGNSTNEEYNTDKAQRLHRLLQNITATKWGIVECLETLGYHFVYIKDEIKICDKSYKILIEE